MAFFIPSERIKRLFNECFWIFFGQVIAIVGSLIGVRVLTGLLSPGAYGELALGITVATLVNQVVMGPLSNGVTRFYAPALEKNGLGGYLRATYRLTLSATKVIIFVFLLVVTGLLITGQGKWIIIVVAALIFAIISGYCSILSGIQNAARQRSIVAFYQGIEPWARFMIATGLILWLGSSSTAAMIGYAFATILVFIFQYKFFRKNTLEDISEKTEEESWRKQILQYSLPIVSWGIFCWAQSASDRWALSFFTKPEDVGLYAVIFQLGYYPISITSGMAIALLAPIFYKRAGSASDRLRNDNVNSLSWRLSSFVLVTGLIIFLATLLFHVLIFRIFVAQEYALVSYLLPWMILAGTVFAAGQTLALNLQSQMKTRLMAMVKIVTALLGVIFNFAGAYFFGIKGVVFANILFSILYFAWMAILSRKITPDLSI